MDMKLRILIAFVFSLFFIGWLGAADQQLLNLVMPDAKVLAGINVDQAKSSPFGQYLIRQIQANDAHFPQIVTATGFDPTRDLDELLIASNAAQPHAGNLTLARGIFNASQIGTAAKNAGGLVQTYKGITIIGDSKGAEGFALLTGTLGVAGDLAGVKAAIDRQTAPTTLPAALLVAVNSLSTTEDAWAISQVPPPTNIAPPHVPNFPALPPNAFQNIQQASGGLTFGSNVVLTAQLQTATPQDATALAGVLQFLANLGLMKAQQDAALGTALKTLMFSASGSTVNVSASLSEPEAEALVQFKPHAKTARPQSQRRNRNSF